MDSGRSAHAIVPASPVHPLPELSRRLDIDLRIKRDDLLPMAGGSSKVRPVTRILDLAGRAGHDAIVTTGGTQSNHARVTALEAARRGWPCTLVLHGSPSEAAEPSGNLLLMSLAGARIDIGPADTISDRIRQATASLQAEGLVPLVIPGGGHTPDGVLSYVEAARELAEQSRSSGWLPEVIVHASGTGTIQAGLLAGLQAAGLETEVIGVSVAREVPRGTTVVLQAYAEACRQLNLTLMPETVRFEDRWVGHGYGTTSAEVLSAIRSFARMEGVLLDPTYTGRAGRALFDLRADDSIRPGTRVLFWHTGGLPNLLAGLPMGQSAR